MEKTRKVLIYALAFLPLALAFNNFFNLTNPLVWGDAPYFYPENLEELFNIPYSWDIRNGNFGSSQLLTLWLYIPTFMLGLLYKIFDLNHEIIIRLIFYLPFFLLGSIGVFSFLSRFEFSNLAKIFGLMLYLLNTYSLVLIDGGQIGVMLSYGLFPLTFFSFLKYFDKNSLSSFLLVITSHFIIFNTDLRIALILVLLELIWLLLLVETKKSEGILKLLALYLIILGLCSFWVIPMFTGLAYESTGRLSLDSSNFTQLINSFYLFQPHFPNNDFGNLNKTPIYFIFLPLILFLGLLKKNKQTIKLTLLFLVFVFLSKGSNPPLGEIYTLLVNNIPLGSAFRDSSKFYIPAFLIASILLANSIDVIQKHFKKNKLFWISAIYIALILTVHPAIIGNLTGVLGKNPDRQDFLELSKLIKGQGSSYRTLWFSERPSLGYADWKHPAVSGNLLFQERPFASMIDGDYDLFGFLHNPKISQWFELLGIKYIFYPPYERKKSLTKKELAERKLFETFISKIPGLKRNDLPVSFPVYETVSPMPKIYSQEKALFIVGGDEIYEELFKDGDYRLEKAGIIFLESCDFNPEILFNLDPKTYLLFSTYDKNDLYMSYFCNNFISPKASTIKEWAVNDSSEYLKWKSQLLERGIRNYDYDFRKGLAYSTNQGEKLEFNLKVPSDGNYIIPVRFLTASKSLGLEVNLEENEKIIKSQNQNRFQWEIIGPEYLNKGEHRITFTNSGGLVVLNTLGLISDELFEQKKIQIDTGLKNVNFTQGLEKSDEIRKLLNTKITRVGYEQISPVEYQLVLPNGVNWLVFSERFDKKMKADEDRLRLGFKSRWEQAFYFHSLGIRAD